MTTASLLELPKKDGRIDDLSAPRLMRDARAFEARRPASEDMAEIPLSLSPPTQP
jgi:hypothetical protein